MSKAFKAVAYHEAGHAVAFWHFGVPVTRISIKRAGNSAGRVEHAAPPSTRSHRDCYAVIIVRMAGRAAQRRFCRRGVRKPHWSDDFLTALAAAEVRCNVDHRKAVRLLNRCNLIAELLVEKEWAKIVVLADALLAHPKKELTENEINALYRIQPKGFNSASDS
jgi:hypothetical protein